MSFHDLKYLRGIWNYRSQILTSPTFMPLAMALSWVNAFPNLLIAEWVMRLCFGKWHEDRNDNVLVLSLGPRRS
jgi:hypothetical protein